MWDATKSILAGLGVRAVDNSNVVPLRYVDRVPALAKENGIPAQYGVTGGANDGAVFLRCGSVDVALGWPLRYSQSPGEVIDTEGLDAIFATTPCRKTVCKAPGTWAFPPRQSLVRRQPESLTNVLKVDYRIEYGQREFPEFLAHREVAKLCGRRRDHLTG